MEPIREQLLELLEGRGAHMPFEAAVADFPPESINDRAPNVAVTPWHLLEHIRIAQRDILDYIRDQGYLAPSWPEEYWPAADARATAAGFAATIQAIIDDRRALYALIADPSTDILAEIPDTPGHTILREIRILSDHAAYHIGEFAILRQVMGTWPAARDPVGT
jgi:alkylation response protein AidB-like acyl-CoA dehydrogenase